MNRRRRKNTVV